MGKQTPSVEWIVAESDADWERLCPLTPPAGDCHRHWSRTYWGIGTLLLLLVGLGGWMWRTEQKVISQLPTKVAATMPPPPATVAQARAELTTSVISDVRSTLHKTEQNNEPAAAWGVEFSKLELWGQRAVVSIVTRDKSKAPAYRQTLFYQRTAAGWQQTAPVAALVGAERTLLRGTFPPLSFSNKYTAVGLEVSFCTVVKSSLLTRAKYILRLGRICDFLNWNKSQILPEQSIEENTGCHHQYWALCLGHVLQGLETTASGVVRNLPHMVSIDSIHVDQSVSPLGIPVNHSSNVALL